MPESKKYYSQKCLICDKQIELLDLDEDRRVLNGGVFCYAEPGYGSCFDSFNCSSGGNRLIFCVCDECLKKKSNQVNIYQEETKKTETWVCKLSDRNI